MNERGFMLLELTIAGVLLAVIFGAVATAISGDAATTRAILAPVGPEMRAQAVIDRIATELRMAGEWGEDIDQDGVLDDGEDGNGNGVLDADWSLADGAVDQASLTFNRRIDQFDEYGYPIASGVYSRRVTYRVEGDRLVREWQRTTAGGVETRSTTLAHDIAGLRFSRTGKLVTVAIDVRLPAGIYETIDRTVTTRIWLRN